MSLIDGIQDLINNINIEFNLNERVEENAIKLNLQSPGKIEFKLPSGQALILLAMILSSGCSGSKGNIQQQSLSNSKTNPTEITKFVNDNQPLLDKVNDALDTLEGDRDKINSF